MVSKINLKENGKAKWKGFFKPTKGKILSTFFLLILSFGYIFIILNTIVDFNPSSYYESALYNPLAILFLFPFVLFFKLVYNQLLPFRFLIFGFILQIIYSYFIISLLALLANYLKYPSKIENKTKIIFHPNKINITISTIVALLIILSYELGNIPGAQFSKPISIVMFVLVFPGEIISVLVSFLFLNSTSLFVDSIIWAVVTISVSVIIWYFISCLMIAIIKKIFSTKKQF
jgi:hypothetical protein